MAGPSLEGNPKAADATIGPGKPKNFFTQHTGASPDPGDSTGGIALVRGD
jgi:hypothetical protein